MKNAVKRVKAVMLVCALVLGILYAPGQAGFAKAASKPHMKSLKINWDLQKNKTIPFTTVIAGVGKKTFGAKISNYKITNAKNGYKKLTFTVTYTNIWKPTKEEVHKAANSVYVLENDSVGAGYYCAVVDYNTGYSLGPDNDLGVTVHAGGWKTLNSRTYKDDHGCWVEFYKTRIKMTVIYPKDYKGLCIGVGGYNQLGDSGADNLFWMGKKPFGKSNYYKKGKASSHFMRVTK